MNSEEQITFSDKGDYIDVYFGKDHIANFEKRFSKILVEVLSDYNKRFSPKGLDIGKLEYKGQYEESTDSIRNS